LILLTGCRNGQLARLVDAGRFADAKRVIDEYIAWFGKDNVFIELQQNFVFGDTRRIEHLVSLARQRDLRYVATGNVHYHHHNRRQLQDVLVAIGNRTTLDGCHRERRPNAEFYLRSPEEMEQIFAGYPEAIRSTEHIAARCATFNLTKNLGYTFPDYRLDSGESQDDYLARACWEAYAAKYPNSTQTARDRLTEELRLIAKLNLSGFFLIYRDLLNLSKDIAAELRGPNRAGSRSYLPPGRGRGSAVSSIVCYLIGLSPIDPIAHNLYIGRFLNEDLPSIPDIDIDFPREIREKMIERVYEVYGADHAALVCAFSTYRLRSAVRDVGKALGLPPADLDRIAKLSEPRGAPQPRPGDRPPPGIRRPQALAAMVVPDRAFETTRAFPATRHPARRWHDYLGHPAQRDRADPARRDGWSLHLPVGQGFLRRRPLHQNRFPRPRHALTRRGMPRPDRRRGQGPGRSQPHRFPRSQRLRHDPGRRYGRRLPG